MKLLEEINGAVIMQSTSTSPIPNESNLSTINKNIEDLEKIIPALPPSCREEAEKLKSHLTQIKTIRTTVVSGAKLERNSEVKIEGVEHTLFDLQFNEISSQAAEIIKSAISVIKDQDHKMDLAENIQLSENAKGYLKDIKVKGLRLKIAPKEALPNSKLIPAPYRLKEVYEAVFSALKLPESSELVMQIVYPIVDYWESPLTQALRENYLAHSSLKTPMLQLEQPITEINLSITDEKRVEINKNESKKQDKKKDASNKKKFSEDLQYFERMYNIYVTETIKPSELFQKRFNEQKNSNKILIIGRPGIGKTTMSQYFAYQWANGKLWQQFDYVFWLPLRNLIAYDAKEEIKVEHVIHQECLNANAREIIQESTIRDILQSTAHNVLQSPAPKSLLVLDGYDEVAPFAAESYKHKPLGKLLNTLTTFPTLILTSRPYYTQQLPSFDRQLENRGFTDNNIKNYIKHYFSSSSQPQESTALFEFLNTNPSIWGSAHVPLNLALICDIWSLAKKNNETLPKEINTTNLYQWMVKYLLRRYLQFKRRIAVEEQPDHWLYQKCSLEIEYLEQLAMRGLISDQRMIITPAIQQKTVEAIEENNKKAIRVSKQPLFKKVLEMGLLNAVNNLKIDSLYKEHYFIHLTFQEYFAARFLVSGLSGANPFCKQEEAIHFIQREKYTLRYQVMFGFVAGLLSLPNADSDIALPLFWNTILSHPLDLTTTRHWSLVIRCLEEAGCDQRIKQCSQLLELVLIGWDLNRKIFLSILRPYPEVSKQSGIVGRLLNDLKEKSKKNREGAVNEVRELGQGNDEIIQALITILHQDEDTIIKQNAVFALSEIGQGKENVIKALIIILDNDNNSLHKDSVVYALGQIGKEKDDAIEALLTVLHKDKSNLVRRSTAEILGRLGQGRKDVIQALKNALLQDKEEGVRWRAANALGYLEQGTDDIIPALIIALHQDKSDYVKRLAASALGRLGQGRDSVFQPLIAALHNNKNASVVRENAADALGRLCQGRDDVIQILLTALHDEKNSDIKVCIVSALAGLSQGRENIIQTLITALHNEKNSDIKLGIAYELSNLKQYENEVVHALITALKKKEMDTTRVTNILVRLGQDSEDVKQALHDVLHQSKDIDEKCSAADALVRLEPENNDNIQELFRCLLKAKQPKYSYFSSSQLALTVSNLMAIEEDTIQAMNNHKSIYFENNFYLSATPLVNIVKAYFASNKKSWATYIIRHAIRERIGISITATSLIIQGAVREEIPWPSMKRVELAKNILQASKSELTANIIAQHYLTGNPAYAMVAVPAREDKENKNKNKKIIKQASSVSNRYRFLTPEKVTSEQEEMSFLNELRERPNVSM